MMSVSKEYDDGKQQWLSKQTIKGRGVRGKKLKTRSIVRLSNFDETSSRLRV